LQMPAAFSRLDKATHKGVLHRNTAARLKSRLMRRLHALESPKAA
jgi:ribosomal protein S20